jgi:hypothetical protein
MLVPVQKFNGYVALVRLVGCCGDSLVLFIFPGIWIFFHNAVFAGCSFFLRFIDKSISYSGFVVWIFC